MADLTSRANVKTAFSITGTDKDAAIDALLTPVTMLIKSYCGRVFDSATYTEYYEAPGSLSTTLLLRTWPVTSVTSIHVSTELPRVYSTDELLTADEAYITKLAMGIVIRTDGSFWPMDVEAVKVICVAGYATLPEDLVRAATEIVGAKLYKGTGALYHISRQDDGEGSIAGIRIDDIPPTARAVLDLYRDRTAA